MPPRDHPVAIPPYRSGQFQVIRPHLQPLGPASKPFQPKTRVRGATARAPRFRGPSIVKEPSGPAGAACRPRRSGTSLPILMSLPSGEEKHPSPGEPLPSSGEPLPSPGEPLPSPGEPLPSPGEPLPSPGEPLPSPGEPLPSPGEPLPSSRECLPSRGEKLAQPGQCRCTLMFYVLNPPIFHCRLVAPVDIRTSSWQYT